MAQAYKILGQAATSATTLTDVYTVPSSPSTSQTVVSSIFVCNRGASATTFRISISPNGAADANSQYIAFDTPIAANDFVAITSGITMDASDIVRCYAGNANLTFSIFGSEMS